MVEIVTKIFLCLLIAALIGAIIGYIIGRLVKCGDNNDGEKNENHKSIYNEDDVYSKYYQNYNIEEIQESNQDIFYKKPAMLTSKKEEVEVEKIDEESKDTLQKIVLEETGLFSASHEIEKMEKPVLMISPERGTPDDLKEISGIGIKIEKMLNDLGVYYFSQIAEWTEENLSWIDDNLGVFKGRAKRDRWIEQAKILASGGETDFSKRVKRGEIDRY